MIPPIRDFMVKSPATIAKTATLREALLEMERQKARHLPVVEEGKVIGILSHRDIQVGMAKHTLGIITVGRAMHTSPYVAREDAALDTVLAAMAEEKYGSVVVVDGEGHPVGIFTTVDALHLFASFLRKAGLAPLR